MLKTATVGEFAPALGNWANQKKFLYTLVSRGNNKNSGNQGNITQVRFAKTACFVAGTKIEGIHFNKTIQSFSAYQDTVWTYNHTSQKRELKVVTGTSKREASALVAVVRAQKDTLWATPEHPFYLPKLKKYIPASELIQGNHLQLNDGSCTSVTSLHWVDTLVTVYNISVADNHNYFAEGVLTHNESCYEPDNFQELFGFTMPDWFWDKMGQKIKVSYTTKRLTSAWNGDQKDLQVVETWYGLLGASYTLSATQNLEVLKGTVIHELGHAYHDLTGRIDPFEVDTKFKKCFKSAKQIVEEIKADTINKAYLWVTKDKKNAVVKILSKTEKIK